MVADGGMPKPRRIDARRVWDIRAIDDAFDELPGGEAEGETIFFKIDYYDRTLTCHSPDPADPAVTERVITIMLADEY